MSNTTAATTHQKRPFQRLSLAVKPNHYKLHLGLDLEKFTFKGNEVIDVDVTSEHVKSVTVNAVELEISEVIFTNSKTRIIATDIVINKEEETATFTFADALPTGAGELLVSFHGAMGDNLKGLYRSKYFLDGKEKYLACTQFEPTDARRCMPCWDEPAVKAKFTCSLTIGSKYTAVSNMPSNSVKDHGDGTKTVAFDPTPIMSTYLLAFVVGELEYIEKKTSKGVAVRVYTTPGKKHQGEFALDVAVKTLPFYENYFGIEYPLTKCDLLAIPDFAAGAMENWGCITYRETALLYDSKISSAQAKQYVALVVGHELAHQWFGNLVTMDWWTHLWLNEGFASYTEYICVDMCFPEWNIWTQFVFEDFERALSLDALSSSHPVEVEVGHPSEVEEIFDAISYSKGSTIIRMLAEFLGLETFKRGVNIYLRRHTYGNTLTEDLWRALSEASQRDVRSIMDSWTKQTGFPLLTVEEQMSTEGNRTFKIVQRRFLDSDPNPKDETLWHVPLTIRTASGRSFSFLLTSREQSIVLPNVSQREWVKFNPRQTGCYRVKYPPHMLELLRTAIENPQSSSNFTAEDRVGILSDLFALSKAGVTSITEALTVLMYYRSETNYTVWTIIAKILRELEVIVSTTDYYGQYKQYVQQLCTPVYQHIGWEPKRGETHLDSMLRALVIGLMGRNDAQAVTQQARERFDRYLKDKKSLHPDLRRVTYSIALSVGGRTVYNQLLDLYKQAEHQEERDQILRSLGAATDASVLRDALAFTLSDQVRSQDSVSGIISISLNPFGRDLAWEFIKSNWTRLSERYSGGFLLTNLLKESISVFYTEARQQEITKFFADNPTPGGDRAIKQGLEKVGVNIKWLQRDGEALRQFFGRSAHTFPPASPPSSSGFKPDRLAMVGVAAAFLGIAAMLYIRSNRH